MKKIVFVIERLFGGGAERVTAALINELCKDAEIHLVSTYDHDEGDDFPTDSRIIKHTNRENQKSWVGVVLGRVAFLRRTILAIKPDCVVSLATPRTNILVTAALLGQKIPVVLSERNDPHRSPSSKLERLLRLWIYRRCDGLVFQTRDARDYFAPAIGKKSVVICNPITVALPDRYEGERERRIINCCRLVPQKNLDLLIDAFADIAGDYPDVRLEIWGEGTERARLEQKVQDLHMADRIIMPGYSGNVYAVMEKALMFVSSSDFEGISNSMLEAMAMGLPTISTDCPIGGAREMIQDGVNGLLVPTGDRAALAAAMRRVLDDPALAQQLGRNGCRLREDISVQVITRKWYDYIQRVMAK